MFVSLDDRPKAISLSKFLVDEVNFSEGLNFVSMTSSLLQTPTRSEHLLVFPKDISTWLSDRRKVYLACE